jgi:PrtD family type I secretion system ABC transporter
MRGDVSLISRFRTPLVQIGILSAVLNILALGGSFFMLMVYDEVMPSRSVPTLIALLVMITLVYLFQAFLDVIRARSIFQIGALFEKDLSLSVFHVVVRHELRMGSLRDPMQPVRDCDQLRTFLSGPGPFGLMDLPWVVLFLAMLFIFHVYLGLLATAGAAILIALTVVANKMTRAPTTAASAAASARHGLAAASRRNAEVLYAMGMEQRAMTGWTAATERTLAANDRLSMVSGGLGSVSKTFRVLLQSLMLATGAALVISDKATGGVMIASSILSSRALAPVEQVIANWSGFLAARQAWARLDALIRQLPADPPVLDLPPPTKSLKVEMLSAGPPGSRRLTVSDVSFELQAGDVLGMIGPSGSGKSSLVRALLGIWSPLRGAVRLDGAALDQWAPERIGAHIGYIPQDVELFDGTISQNIARFEPDADPVNVLAAAEAARVHDLIIRLPNGYETVLGPEGNNLSAGQRQRVALARALYRDPFLILLDEPNSNLDSEGEQALLAAIAAAAQRGAIVILVAHRPSALAVTNKVLYLSNGKARAFGGRDQVLEQLKLAPPREGAAAPGPQR